MCLHHKKCVVSKADEECWGLFSLEKRSQGGFIVLHNFLKEGSREVEVSLCTHATSMGGKGLKVF